MSSLQKSRQRYTLSSGGLLILLSLEGPPQHPGHTPPSPSPSHIWLLPLLPTGPGPPSSGPCSASPTGPSAETDPTEHPVVPRNHIFIVPQNTLLWALFSPHGAWARLQSWLPCMSPPEISSGPGLSPRHASLLSCDFKKIYEPCRVSSGLDPALRLRSHLHMEPQTVGTSQRIGSMCPLLPAPSSLAHRGWNTGGAQ